jgi:hypothetical protein
MKTIEAILNLLPFVLEVALWTIWIVSLAKSDGKDCRCKPEDCENCFYEGSGCKPEDTDGQKT